MMNMNFDAIPQELKDLPQWVNRGRDRITGEPNKVPIDPKTGKGAKANDPSTWGTYQTALSMYEKGDVSGIGFEFHSDGKLAGIDLDHCVDENGNISPDAMRIIMDFGSYSEFSASGTGIHIICKGKLPLGGCKKGNIEMYDQGRYFIMSGDVIKPYTEIHECQEHINALHREVFADRMEKKGKLIKKIAQDANNAISNQVVSSADEEKIENIILNSKSSNLFLQLMKGDWQATTKVSGKEYASQSEADLALLGILAFYTGKKADLMKEIFKKSCLYRAKCDEKHRSDGATYLDISIETAIGGCENIYGPISHDDLQSRLRDFNNKYAVSMLSNRFVIIDETTDEVEFLRLNDFKQFHQNIKIRITDKEGGTKTYIVVDLWIKWEGRRQYQRIEFKPGKDIAPNYNLWRGFAVIARKGDWSLMQDHIENNICRGREQFYRYIYAWLARIYQHPGEERPGVAIVLRGKPGTGKGIFARYSGRPLIKHFVHVFSPNQFAGRFNAHLKNCILLFADEAFMSDNKEAAGLLRGMITEPYIMCEPKGIDAFRIENHINVIAAGNASYIVPAGEAERRFCVVDVSDTHIQDSEYFRKLCTQMDNGGVEAMFHDLLALDISKIDLRDFPRSNALFDQQLMGMSHIQQWWLECLKFGTLDYEAFGYDNKGYWPAQ